MLDQFLCSLELILLAWIDHYLEVACILDMVQDHQVIPFPRRGSSWNIVLPKLFSQNLRRSTFWSLECNLEVLRISVCTVGASCPALDYRSEVDWSLLTLLWVPSLLPIYSSVLVALHFIQYCELCESCAGLWNVFGRDRMLFNHRTKRNYRPFEWFAKSPFVRCSPVRQEVWNISQIAVTLNGICPPFFFQASLQQHCRRSFFDSAYYSFSNTTCLRTMKCWRAMIPG